MSKHGTQYGRFLRALDSGNEVLILLSVVGATVSPLALVGLVLAALVVFAARPRTSAPVQDPLVAALSGYGDGSVG